MRCGERALLRQIGKAAPDLRDLAETGGRLAPDGEGGSTSSAPVRDESPLEANIVVKPNDFSNQLTVTN